MLIKVWRMGVSMKVLHLYSLASVPMMSAGRSSLELMVSPAARADPDIDAQPNTAVFRCKLES